MRLPALAAPAALALAVVAAAPIRAADRAGDFDYFILALSWSPTWCALEGDQRNAGQCDPDRDFGWVLHGLWPQNETGYPQDCTTTARDPAKRDSQQMADVMGSAGLAWYEWKKHGRCTGLSGTDYYRLSRQAFDSIARPAAIDRLSEPVTLPPAVVEDAFLDANPQLTRQAVTVTCEEGRIDEVRICLTRDLDPRACGADVARDCALPSALLDPVR